MSKTRTIKSHIKNGIAAKIISLIRVPGGADPFMTKSSMPKGGVDIAISRLTSIKIANQIGSYPKSTTMGMKMGIVIIIMETCSINVPRIISISIGDLRQRDGDPVLETDRSAEDDTDHDHDEHTRYFWQVPAQQVERDERTHGECQCQQVGLG